MKKSKNKRTAILVAILLGLLVLAYKIMFAPSDADLIVDENIVASQRVEKTLKDIESIRFDTSIIDHPNFKSLKSIEIPLLSLPVGRKNPFSGVLR